jgi:predicted acylesterase/phospholipase RssA
MPVRASMSIPFFYKPTRLTDAGGRDCWLVDGAMLSRFPSMRSTPRRPGATLADARHQAVTGQDSCQMATLTVTTTLRTFSRGHSP